MMVATPVAGEAGTGSCPRATSRWTTFAPTRPLPPMTTIFMILPPPTARTGEALWFIDRPSDEEESVSARLRVPIR